MVKLRANLTFPIKEWLPKRVYRDQSGGNTLACSLSTPTIGKLQVGQRRTKETPSQVLTLRDVSLAPARLFIQADTQCGFSHHFMREKGISWVDPAQTRIAD